MIPTQPIGFLNTGLPVVSLALLVILIPRLILPAGTLSHQVLAVAIAVTALITLAFGAVFFALSYGWLGAPVWATFQDAPTSIAAYFLRLSAMAALIWGPVLALVWYTSAQGVERRRGEARAARKDDQ